MAYVKIIYQNSPSTATPINAENLNHMDDQIALNDQRLTEIETSYVKSFKGRKGEVVPEDGDYDIGQIAPLSGAQVGQVPVVTNIGTEEDPELVFRMGAGGGGGHSIIDSSGNTMPQESAMQFADSFVSDDSVNGRTVVENIKEHTTASDYENATEDGIHVIDDGNDVPIGTPSEDYVEVTADGVKTYSALFDELFADADLTKLSETSYIEFSDSYYRLVLVRSSIYYFERTVNLNTHLYADTIQVSSSDSKIVIWDIKTNGNTQSDVSSTVPTVGDKITLYYGTSSTVINLKTDANYCNMQDGTTVQQRVGNSNFGTRVNIASYTSSANKYTCPSDGYVRFEGTGGVSLELNDVTMFQNTNLRTSIYVRKGMTVWFSAGTLSTAEFIPFVQ